MNATPTVKQINCILPPGIAAGVLARLKREHGITEAHLRTARGIGKLTPAGYRKAGAQTEKEMLTIVVPAERADMLFAWLFREARIDRPHGGIVYMMPLARATPYILPDLPEEK